jgi:hypothetical protein
VRARFRQLLGPPGLVAAFIFERAALAGFSARELEVFEFLLDSEWLLA